MRTNPALDRVGAHPIAGLQQKVRRLRDQGADVIDFTLGDPTEPTWEAIPEQLRRKVPAVSQYPTTNGLAELRRAIAGYVRRRFGVSVDPDTQVIPTSGAKEAIFSTALAFVDRDRGDAVGYPDPGYPVYARGAVLAGAEAVPVPAGPDFVTTVESVPTPLWERMALLWICTPSNPTGAVMGEAELAAVVSEARRHDVLVCSDECYVDLYAEGAQPPPSVLQVADGTEGVLAYLSLSKRSGMTGYRSGAIVGDPAAIERLYRLRTSTGTASPEFVQWAAVTAWEDDEHVAERRRIFDRKRQILREGLEAAGLKVVASEAGLYLWVAVEDDLAAAETLAEAGVFVSPGRIFGERGFGHLRLALVPDIDTCRRAADLIRQALVGV
jgi:succinyldiaminopimelate transaminase